MPPRIGKKRPKQPTTPAISHTGTHDNEFFAEESVGTGLGGSNETRWLLTDHLGTIRDAVDNTGTLVNTITYTAFGNITSQTDPSETVRVGFTGYYHDSETGLDYAWHRYYNAEQGRFTSVDPMGFDAGDTTLYRYVANNPLGATDPRGTYEGEIGKDGTHSGIELIDALTGLADAAGDISQSVLNGIWGNNRKTAATDYKAEQKAHQNQKIKDIETQISFIDDNLEQLRRMDNLGGEVVHRGELSRQLIRREKLEKELKDSQSYLQYLDQNDADKASTPQTVLIVVSQAVPVSSCPSVGEGREWRRDNRDETTKRAYEELAKNEKWWDEFVKFHAAEWEMNYLAGGVAGIWGPGPIPVGRPYVNGAPIEPGIISYVPAAGGYRPIQVGAYGGNISVTAINLGTSEMVVTQVYSVRSAEPTGTTPITDPARLLPAAPERPALPQGRPTPAESEAKVTDDFGWPRQQSYSQGRVVGYGEKGSVRPDNTNPTTNVHLDVKNYDLSSPSNRANLYNTIADQASARAANLPKGAHQGIVIDIRGQTVNPAVLRRIPLNIETATGGTIPRTNVVFLTNSGYVIP